MFIVWLIVVVNKDGREVIEMFLIFLLSFIPFTLLILGKYIVHGKFYIFKIEEGEEKKLRDSSRKDDSKNSNQDFDDPPFPDGF